MLPEGADLVIMSLDDETAAKIADLAKVPSNAREYFRKLIDRALRDACRAPATRAQHISSTGIVEQLTDIGKAARSLERKLTQDRYAAQFLEAKLMEKKTNFECYFSSLRTLQSAASRQ